MLEKARKSTVRGSAAARVTANMELQRTESLLRTGALQTAILTSPNFSIIATDEKGIIQLFSVGAERILGYLATEVVNKIIPSDIKKGMEAGFFRYFTKPIMVNEFMDALGIALEFSAARAGNGLKKD